MVDNSTKKFITKSFKTRLKTSEANDKALKNMAGAYRILYNMSMHVMEVFSFLSIQSNKHLLNQIEVQQLVKSYLSEEENIDKYSYLSKIEQGTRKAAILEANYINNTRYPYAISKLMRRKDGLKFKTTTQIKIFEDYIHIPKCGDIKLFEKNYLPQNAVLSDITFKQQGGKWWISFKATMEVEDKRIEREFNNLLRIGFKDDGTLVVNNKEYPSIITTEKYQKEFKRLRGLLEKYKRQCEANSEYHGYCSKTLVVSRNMLKLRQKIETSTSRLYNMKLDYFRKIACSLAKTKSGSAQFLSNDIIRKQQNKHLSRVHREAGTAHFFDILRRKLQHSGVILHRINSEGVIRPELQGIMACGGLDEYRRMAQKSGSMKQVLNSAA